MQYTQADFLQARPGNPGNIFDGLHGVAPDIHIHKEGEVDIFHFPQYYKYPQSNFLFHINWSSKQFRCMPINIDLIDLAQHNQIIRFMIHGHKKSDKKKTEHQQKQEDELSHKINTKLAEFFQVRNQPISHAKIPSLIEFTTILMQLCPDITTIFNYRRELINKILATQQQIDQAKTLGGEIKLITKIIQGDPKSYTLWSYRQWLVLKLYDIDTSMIEKEKELCSVLLMKDEKNFHVWNYRNWANNIKMNVDFELEFTKVKIDSNPFNFSPYHFRSKYLIWKYSQLYPTMEPAAKQDIVTYGMPKSVFDAELETVRTAIFLNPKEEAPWLYYSWLLKQILPALLLSIETDSSKQGLVFTLIFSLKIKSLHEYLEFPASKISCQSNPSNTWKISFGQKIEACQIVGRPNSRQIQIQNESGGRRLVWANTEDIEEVRSIYRAEEIFLDQVLESEEYLGRFAWLQVLDLYRCLLSLGVNAKEWDRVTTSSAKAFQFMEKEVKGHKYLEKQKLQWERLGNEARLTDIERKLKNYRP